MCENNYETKNTVSHMWVKTVGGWRFVEAEQTSQGLWLPKINNS